MRYIFILVLGFALAACKSSLQPPPAEPLSSELVLLPVRSHAISIRLSGAAEAQPDWERASATGLEDALIDAFAAQGVQLRRAAMPMTDPLLIRAERVLPEAANQRSLPTAGGVDRWSLGPLPDEADRVLIVFHQATRTTAAHQLADIGLGLALAEPLLPDRGSAATYVALAQGVEGDLTWVARFDDGDARHPKGARQIAEEIAERLAAGAS